MRWTVSQAAAQTGISVRTLHYYDQIGLLKPTVTTDNGYRYYDREALEKLQQILFYRELDFSLKEIGDILSMPDYNRLEAMASHRELLLLKRERLDGLILLVERTLKGDDIMSFKEFDMAAIEQAKEQYAVEARERWGHTEVFEESARRTGRYGKEDWERIQKEADSIFREFSRCRSRQLPCDSKEAMELVRRWKEHITDYYYTCTDEILGGLGVMYAEDERFCKSIDQAGEGTAHYMSRAIENFVKYDLGDR